MLHENMGAFKTCPGRFSVSSGSYSVGILGVSLSSSVSTSCLNGPAPRVHRRLSGSSSSSFPNYTCTKKASQGQKKMLVMLYHTKNFNRNAAIVTHAARKLTSEPRLGRPCLPTLERKIPRHSKDQKRFFESSSQCPKNQSIPVLAPVHCSFNSKIGVFNKSRPHKIGQANRYYSFHACAEPITGQPTVPGEYACISRTSSLVQDEPPKSAPPLDDLTPDESPDSLPEFWSYSSQKSPDGKDIIVHYCKSLKNMEKIAKFFADDKVLGFDMEWKAQASAFDSLQSNISLIQIANRSRIALFQVAMFKPARGVKDLVAPTLKKILESPDITKVGVSIKADCTRLRKFLKIDTRAIFELSHLHKLVKYCHSNPRLINKRLVSLNDQVEEHFGLPLVKDESVRCSDWTVALNYPQVQYAATDPYACICLFDALNAKRQSLDPMPPLPAHAELDLPIRVVDESAEKIDSDDVESVDQETETPAKEDT